VVAPHPAAADDAPVISLTAAATAPSSPQPHVTPLALPIGYQLHEYRVDKVLGQGGFGITYRRATST
jgi:hypothetical protein